MENSAKQTSLRNVTIVKLTLVIASDRITNHTLTGVPYKLIALTNTIKVCVPEAQQGMVSRRVSVATYLRVIVQTPRGHRIVCHTVTAGTSELVIR